MQQRVLVVGGSGLVGTRVVRQLRDAGAEVTSLDRVRATVTGVHEVVLDIVRADPAPAFDAAKPHVVIHLAARIDPPGASERDAMRRLHEDGFRRVFRAADAAGAARFVFASSSVVYGAWPDNPVPLLETAPRRPRNDFPYALDKSAQEDIAHSEPTSMSVAWIRPAVIYAAEAKNYLTELLRYAPKFLPAVDGHQPPLQFVHADDVASALRCLAATPSAIGPFNVGADAMAYAAVARQCGLRVVTMPRRLLAPAANLGARWVPSRFRAPAYVLDQLSFPFVVDATRLKTVCGWSPAWSSAGALHEMLRGASGPLRRR